jgi:3'(2'), 5'-bisphosphate nucleotidase
LLSVHRSLAPADDGSPRLPSLVRKTMYSMRGGRPFALEAAAAAAKKVMLRRLSRLNAEIPIVARDSHDLPHAERLRWNHFWLVDPLDGEAGFGTSEGGFTVNLALIEDGKPIAGVVHAPLVGTTWYAMVGKGAFKAVAGGNATRLTADTAMPPPSAAGAAPSRALALCLQVETIAGGSLAGTMAWHSAAPHALARLIGRRVVGAGSNAELAYNRDGWINPPVRVA